MNAESIVTVSALVVTLVQLAKWAGLDDSKGPLAVLLFSVIGVALWGADQAHRFGVGVLGIWPYMSGLVAVMTSAAGTFGLTRATGKMLTRGSDDPR